MELVQYKVLSTGEKKKTDFAHLQSMIDIDSRCANRSFEVDDKRYEEVDGILLKKKKVDTKRSANTKATEATSESGIDTASQEEA